MGNYPSILLHYVNDYHANAADGARVVPRYGWVPDVPDRRDLVLAHYPTDTDDSDASVRLTPDASTDILRVDLRKQCPAIYDDEGLGCSTVSALATLLEFHELRTRPNGGYEPSRLCWYYLIRELRGTERADAGASFREALKIVNDEGVCDEVDWPFNVNMMAVPPDWSTYESVPRSRPLVYRRVPQTLEALKYCLTHNLPVAFGLSVYASFESSITRRTGQIALPACALDLVDSPVAEPSMNDSDNERTASEADDDMHLGGHALVLVGYDDTEQMFIVRNSLGTSWGANGYGFVPYSYVLNPLLARDFWVVDGDAEAETHATVDAEAETRATVDADDVTTVDSDADKKGADEDTEASDTYSTIPPLFRTILDRVGT